MGEHTSLKALFQSLVISDMAIVTGTVTKASPLTIKLDNDIAMVLDSDSLIVPQHLSNYKVPITGIDGVTNITIKNALKKGDNVVLLSFNGGEDYFILDREEADS